MKKATNRRIGPFGTISRLLVGGLLLAVAVTQPVDLSALVLGGVVMPGMLLIWQWVRTLRDPSQIRSIGPISHLATVAAFFAMYLTPVYAPALSVTSGAALIFFGGSMIVAALRGYRGCEVLAISNWLLRRNDQLGCVLFSPIDRFDSAGRATLERDGPPER